ncbi:MAG: DNA-binding protein WhiA [Gaiellaceae bacterium]|jgi:DNA-binding protein WhiA
MALSETLREELAHLELRRECDRLAELSALFHSAGRAHLEGKGKISVHLDLASAAVARRAFSSLRAFGVFSEIRTYHQRAFEHANRFQLYVAGSPRALQLLNEAGVLDAALAPIETPPLRVVARLCCRAAYLRGALLGSGSLSAPPSLHLEIRTTSGEGARFLAEIAAREEIELHLGERDRYAFVYAKGSEPITDLLALAGASATVLALAERSVIGETRAGANRLANADQANIARASRAALAQLEAVRRLERWGAIDRLSPVLREAAELRLRHPHRSVSELARRSGIPKPTLHGRLHRLQVLAKTRD